MEYLKEINHKRNILEQKLYDANKNEHLLELMKIQKSLVYFVTALRSNELLLAKMTRTNFLKINEEEEEFLEDLMVDNSQALEMANIYSNILASTMDTFASIIANIKKISDCYYRVEFSGACSQHFWHERSQRIRTFTLCILCSCSAFVYYCHRYWLYRI